MSLGFVAFDAVEAESGEYGVDAARTYSTLLCSQMFR